MRQVLLTALLLAAAGGGAHAADDPLRAAAFRRPASSAALPGPTDGAHDFGMPTTAVEHRFRHSGATGSAGFLCGLQPKAMTDGAAAAYGVDPHGRFLGVKLHLAFR